MGTLQERAAAVGYQVTPLGDGVGYDVDFQDGGQNAMMTGATLEGFVAEREEPLPPAPTTLVGKFSAFVENTTGYKLF